MVYRISNTDRKATAQKIAELYEARVQYAGMPTANYQLIDKNGETVLILKKDCTVEASNSELLALAEDNGLIVACDDERLNVSNESNTNEVSAVEATEDTEVTEDNDVEDSTGVTANNANENEDSESDEMYSTTELETVSCSSIDEGTSATSSDNEETAIEQEDYDKDDDKDEAYSSRSSTTENTSLSIPIDNLNIYSLKHILKELYVNSHLLTKATEASLEISPMLMDELNEAETFEELLSFLREAEHADGLKGLMITDSTDNTSTTDNINSLVFSGFCSEDAMRQRANSLILEYLFKFASSKPQKKISLKNLKVKMPENEKFSFRIWLIRLGWKGNDNKKERNILYKKLSGNTAFCTQESKDRWEVKHSKQSQQQ